MLRALCLNIWLKNMKFDGDNRPERCAMDIAPEATCFPRSWVVGAHKVCELSIPPRADQPHLSELILSFMRRSERHFALAYDLSGQDVKAVRRLLGMSTSRVRSSAGSLQCVFTDAQLSMNRSAQHFLGRSLLLDKRRNAGADYVIVLSYQECESVVSAQRRYGLCEGVLAVYRRPLTA